MRRKTFVGHGDLFCSMEVLLLQDLFQIGENNEIIVVYDDGDGGCNQNGGDNNGLF